MMNNPEDEPKPKRRAKTDDKSCTSSGTNDDSAGTSDDMVGDINDIILFMYFFFSFSAQPIGITFTKYKSVDDESEES
jgi:hypothetical protein